MRVMAERSALRCVLEHSESGIAYRTALFFAALTIACSNAPPSAFGKFFAVTDLVRSENPTLTSRVISGIEAR